MVDCLLGWSIGLVDWSVNWLVGQFIGWSVDVSGSLSDSRFVGQLRWSVSRLLGQFSVGWLVGLLLVVGWVAN